MYSNKDNVNILTALLVKWGVKCAVVCPGSRNAPIVNNLDACPEIECYPVTDERSAGFFALGLSQIEDEPVAVCVTSGSALLNVAPATAEAFYQYRKLIIISADRPACLIDQLQGQTMQQPGALQGIVRKAVSLPEPHDDTERWYCNRLVNEALMEMERGEGGPVHINVPISEPLFDFSVEQLPDERRVMLREPLPDYVSLAEIAQDFKKAKRPLVLIGQHKPEDFGGPDDSLQVLENYTAVLYEKIGDESVGEPLHLEEMLIDIEGDEEAYMPDFIVYLGGSFVSKRIKEMLQRVKGARVVVANRDGKLHDVLMNTTDVVQAGIIDVINGLASAVDGLEPTPYLNMWRQLSRKCRNRFVMFNPGYSQMGAMRRLIVATIGVDCEFQYANSTAVRLANIYSMFYSFTNRGINGIDGCLSTAVGYAAGIEALVFCVIGDLSFFYDQNALWNMNLTSNLRVLLLNNGGGGIFHSLPGLDARPTTNNFVTGAHDASAEGICMENNVRYLSAHNSEELDEGLQALVDPDSMLPVVLEVFTDMEEDQRVLKDYLFGNTKNLN